MITPIPWSSPDEWQQVEIFFHSLLKRKDKYDGLQEVAREIEHHYLEVDEVLSEVCSLTCCVCSDICCLRATVWYDFRDLLFHFVTQHNIPSQQIGKTLTGCSQVTTSGCRLARKSRPFICTWYLCPDQISQLKNRQRGRNMIHLLKGIQLRRKEMEDEFLRISFDRASKN